MAQSQDLDCAPHSPLGQCSVVLDRACPVVSSTQPLPEGVQRQPALPGNERSSVDRGASTPPAEAVEETVKGALIPSPTPRLKKRTYDTERRGMTWHAADMPLPAGAVQAFSTLEAEPPQPLPWHPALLFLPVLRSSPRADLQHAALPNAALLPALLHCTPLSAALTATLRKPFTVLLHGLERTGSFGSSSSKQHFSLLTHHPIPQSAWPH